MIIGCSVTSIAWAVGSDALGLDAGLRFTFTYLLAGIPIGILAIGSVTLTLTLNLTLTLTLALTQTLTLTLALKLTLTEP